MLLPGRAGVEHIMREYLSVRHRDETADPSYDVTEEETTSVTTDRSMDEIAAGSRVWHSNR